MANLLDPIIKQLKDELLKERNKNKKYFFAQNDFYEELTLFWEEIISLANILDGFGNPIKFTYPIKTRSGIENLKFTFNPYYIDPKYSKKEKEIFYCDFNKEEYPQKGKIKSGFYFSFYPDLEELTEEELKERETKRKKALEEDKYLDDTFYFFVPNYIFLQIYNNKDKFLDELREQCIDILQAELESTRQTNLLIDKFKN